MRVSTTKPAAEVTLPPDERFTPRATRGIHGFNPGQLRAKFGGRGGAGLSASARDSAEQVFDGPGQVVDVGLVDVGVRPGRLGRLVAPRIDARRVDDDA